jgi:hypothetical protein
VTLSEAGVQLFKNKPGTGVRKIHHKLMVIDDQLLIVGNSRGGDGLAELLDGVRRLMETTLLAMYRMCHQTRSET